MVAVPAVDREQAGVCRTEGDGSSAGAGHGGFVQQGRHGTGHAVGKCVDKSTENDMTVRCIGLSPPYARPKWKCS